MLTLLIVGFSIGFDTIFGRRLSQAIATITHGLAVGAAHVYQAARQITHASDALAKSSGSQATSVEETSSMIARILDETQATTRNASRARQMIQSTSSIIEESNQTTQELNGAMRQIPANSEET